MTVDRLEVSSKHVAKFSSRTRVRCLGFILTMILLVAFSSPLAVAQAESTLAQTLIQADTPLFRLPYSKSVNSLSNGSVDSQEGESAEGESEEEGEVEHRNELALILAGTYESSEEENYFTIGAEYEYRFHPRVGISGTIEYISGPDAWILVFPVVFHPKGGLKILAGPGVELKPRRGSGGDEDSTDSDTSDGEEDSGTDKLFLFRIGVAYSFEFGERYSITPALELDFVKEEEEVAKALVYGVTFGISF